MSTWLRLIQTLSLHFHSQQQLDQSYLEEAVDNCDLERRMHALDQRGAAWAHANPF